MYDLYRELTLNQFHATLAMFGNTIDQCPPDQWHAKIARLTFNQAAFHALFFTDVYLGPDLKSLREQPFHHEHAAVFADYEELEDRAPQAGYEKSFIQAYVLHCKEKAARVINSESPEDLQRRPGFDWQDFSRAELHVYNLRHLQHHAAHLSLHLRRNTAVDVPWVRSRWPDDPTTTFISRATSS